MTDRPAFTERPWPPIRNAVVGSLSMHRPHTAYGTAEVDVTRATAAIAAIRRRTKVPVSFHAFVLHCVAQAAAAQPDAITVRRGGKLITFRDADVATALDRSVAGAGRVAVGCTVRGAQAKSLAQIDAELRAAMRRDPMDDPDVRRRRRFAAMPAVVRALTYWRMRRDPFMAQRFLGTIGVTSLRHPMMTRPFFAFPPNLFTVTIAAGGQFTRHDPDGTPRRILCLVMGMDHAIMDGMAATRFSIALIGNLESALGLDETFGAEL